MRHAHPSLFVPPLALLGACALIATAEVPADARAASDSAAAQAVPAHWVKKKIYFVYQGFTAHYSCEGLRDDIRLALLQLGARRSDMNVRELGCTTGLGVPNAAPGVTGTFSVLEPAADSQAPSAEAVKARWVAVRVQLNPAPSFGGDCELIDQIKQKIIPLVTARNVKFTENCIPHQLQPPGSQLQAEVLMPVGVKPVSPAGN